MSLKHAILSLLIESEKTGYDLTKNFESSIGYYWAASHQQIYKTLSTMLEGALIDQRVSTQKDRPDKKLYSVTEAGMQELRQWAVLPAKRTPTKNQLLVKLVLARLVGREPILHQLNQRLKEVYEDIATYTQIEKQYFTPKPSVDTHVKNTTGYLTLRNGILFAHAELDWLHEAIDMLESQM